MLVTQTAHGSRIADTVSDEDAKESADAFAAFDSEHSRVCGAVLWLTGLSGAGKSTLAFETSLRMRARGRAVAVVDGDYLRINVNKELGFTRRDRQENCRRAMNIALGLALGGAVVFVSLISPFRIDREFCAAQVRRHGVAFAEIFVHSPLSVCERRDPKGLYRRARLGQLEGFTGITAPYEQPQSPYITLNTAEEDISFSTATLLNVALGLSRASDRLLIADNVPDLTL